ncbi:MAG: hypothetical protein IT282_09795 [Bacteroidetes bacterium]|nr:hypothetical protein [Bacteroidota bacterium]
MNKTPIMPVLLCLFGISCTLSEGPDRFVKESEEGITAGYKYPGVSAAMLKVDTSATLVSITTDAMNPNGTAQEWSYKFRSSISPYVSYYYTATYVDIRYDSLSGLMTCGDARITHSWVNSNVAAGIAESQGGETFRKNNPDCAIWAGLGEPLIPNPSVWWHFTYCSRSDPSKRLNVRIDAATAIQF